MERMVSCSWSVLLPLGPVDGGGWNCGSLNCVPGAVVQNQSILCRIERSVSLLSGLVVCVCVCCVCVACVLCLCSLCWWMERVGSVELLFTSQ